MDENKESEQRRNEFVDTAERLFHKNGIVETTISSIVKELDVAKGLFYYYFDSKEDVIDAISEKYNSVFNEEIKRNLNEEYSQQKLNEFVENVVSSFRELSAKLQGTSDEIDLTTLEKKTMTQAKDNAINSLEEVLEESVRLGDYAISQSKYYANILISGIVELVEQGEATNEEIKEIILKLIEDVGKEK